MKETGKDLNSAYKETSLGGLAKEFGLNDVALFVIILHLIFVNRDHFVFDHNRPCKNHNNYK